MDLLATIPGTFDNERKIHHSLDKWVYGWSWYVDCEPLRSVLRDFGFALETTDHVFHKPETAKYILEARRAADARLKHWT